ncbi:MAG: amino acid ABC transporter permease [Treponema sp.]|jgi:His/Glu/Gln/Arg/opine family amino acid ABC transporter permease subunit|nr:amino acid ABC transporter permease [Treponema sp.]
MGLSFDPSFFFYEITVALSYIPMVTLLSAVPLIGGVALGTVLALCRIYHIPGWRRFAQAYVTALRSIPLLLQMFLAYFITKAIYAVFGFDQLTLNKLGVVVVMLTLDAAGFLSEGIRSALLSVEKGQYEAGYSVGLTGLQVIRHIVLPQSLPVAVPIVGSSFIAIVKGSSAAYLLGIIEMIQGTAMKTAGNYRYLEAYCAVALMYWAITILIEQLTGVAEKNVRLHMKGGVS